MIAMDRRSFVFGAAGLLAAPGLSQAQMPMRAAVAHPALVRQQCPEWCWAASASMIFGSSGHPTDQKKFVVAAFGGLVCGPQLPRTITQILYTPWIDDNGQQFLPQVEAGYDQLGGIVNINNAFIINELMQNRPLLYANTHPCMVVVQADYIPTPAGPNIVNVIVLDPFPGNPPVHPLSPPELVPAFQGGQMMYLAAVRI
jgi:hypothetical protein